jgi:hypothetical protein
VAARIAAAASRRDQSYNPRGPLQSSGDIHVCEPRYCTLQARVESHGFVLHRVCRLTNNVFGMDACFSSEPDYYGGYSGGGGGRSAAAGGDSDDYDLAPDPDEDDLQDTGEMFASSSAAPRILDEPGVDLDDPPDFSVIRRGGDAVGDNDGAGDSGSGNGSSTDDPLSSIGRTRKRSRRAFESVASTTSTTTTNPNPNPPVPAVSIAVNGRVHDPGVLDNLRHMAREAMHTLFKPGTIDPLSSDMQEFINDTILYLWSEVVSTNHFKRSSQSYSFAAHCQVILKCTQTGLFESTTDTKERLCIVRLRRDWAPLLQPQGNQAMRQKFQGRFLDAGTYTRMATYFKDCIREIIHTRGGDRARRQLASRFSTTTTAAASAEQQQGAVVAVSASSR